MGQPNKRPIVVLVERGGSEYTFHAAHADKVTVSEIVTDNIAHESRLHTDETRHYFGTGEPCAAQEIIRNSSGEYVRVDVHTNSADF